MANRILPDGSGAIGTGPSGPAYMAMLKEKIDILMNSIALRPVSITNVGNDYTIVIDPVLLADVVSPMTFFIRPNVDNTGAVRMRVTSSNPYYSIVRADGTDFASGEFKASIDYQVTFLGGKFVVLSDDATLVGNTDPVKYVFTSSGTLDVTTIKANSATDRPVYLRAWGGGGGGGGGFGGGGGGGGYAEKLVKLSELPDVISYTVGAGGAGGVNASGVAGGNSSIASLVTAYGGGRGAKGTNPGARGGGGASGGAFSAGGNATDGGVAGGTAGFCGANGPNGWNGTTGGAAGGGSENPIGGGAGASSANAANGFSGGNAINGGAGGGSQGTTGSAGAGGVSLNGGAGGAGANSGTAGAGVAPGGGGGGAGQTSTGTGGAGARGQVEIWFF